MHPLIFPKLLHRATPQPEPEWLPVASKSGPTEFFGVGGGSATILCPHTWPVVLLKRTSKHMLDMSALGLPYASSKSAWTSHHP